MKGRYAIVWRYGEELYTHSDDSGTLTFSYDEIVREDVPFVVGPLEKIPTHGSGRVAVSIEELNKFLGVE